MRKKLQYGSKIDNMKQNKKKRPMASLNNKPKLQGGGNFGQTMGNIISGASPLLNFIPGVGPILGGLAGMIGGGISKIGQNTNEQSVELQQNINSNPYGMPAMKYGGKMGFAQGGDLNELSSQAFQVDADQPALTDSVETEEAFLDHGEVVTGDNVYSDKIVNPQTNRTFAKEEEMIQKKLGKFEKQKIKSGDLEMKDDKYLNLISQGNFQMQEKIASQIGLRNQDGSPLQGKTGLAWGGNKKAYVYGGGAEPTPDQEAVDDIFRTFMSATTENGDNPQYFNPSQGVPNSNAVIPGAMNQVAGLVRPDLAVETDLNNPYKDFRGEGPPNGPQAGGNLPGMTFNAGRTMPGLAGQPLSTNQIPGVNAGSLGAQGDMPGGFDVPDFDTTQATIPEEDNFLDKIKRGFRTKDSGSGTGDGGGAFGKGTPLGTAGTLIGLGSNIMNTMTLKPDLVKYNRIGDRQIRQQSLAMQNLLAGKSESLRGAQMQGQAAMSNLTSRSLQSRNANLRNIAQGTSSQKAKTQGMYADKISGARERFGQVITGVEKANLQTRMMEDDINTREKDQVRTEKMKMTDNVRKLLIEAQLAKNSSNKNQILEKLLGTKNFKFDMNSPEGIKFITTMLNNK